MHSRRRKPIRRLTYVASVVGVVLAFGFVSTAFTDWSDTSNTGDFVEGTRDVSFTSRHLLSLSNCTPPAIEQFPKDYFSQHERRRGAVSLHIILAAYMFLALAIACDDYFVPSCERICEALNLQDDVAGATFMAAGSSAPELATAVIGVFIAKDDIALSSVVGSAIFNIMFVISLCALFAGSVVYLKWWPLLRDCLFYTLSIILLVIAIMDEEIHWYEALVFLVMYIVYIILMFFNPRVEAWIVPKCSRLFRPGDERKRARFGSAELLASLANNNDVTESEELDNANCDGVMETEFLLPPGDSVAINNGVSNGEGHFLDNDGVINSTSPSIDDGVTEDLDLEPEPAEDSKWVWAFPDRWYKRALWVISLPIILVMFFTVPDCRQPRWKRWFIMTFVMSIVWIGAYSYLMVWMITVVGHTFRVPDSVMSLTLIAAGSSVPDAIASLIVVREGHGDMAVSNAVGSNVFDILLCLGLPWFIQTTLVNRSEPVQVYSAGLTYSSLTLLSTVVLLLVLTHFNRWRLTKPYGAVLMVIYIAFNVLSCLYELNVFGYVHPPECE